jgi:hypothetical protein
MTARFHPDYETLLAYIRNYSTDEPPYDVVGVIHLLLAALENLREHRIEADLEDFARCATPEQREYLIEVGQFLCGWTDSE